MSDRANGYFEAFINERAARQSAADRALMVALTAVVNKILPGSQMRWAGSQHKGTAIAGSDLDVCVESQAPVTESQRRLLRDALEKTMGRPARVLSHAIRLPTQAGTPKVDIAFANAAFGSRPLPDEAPFRNRRSRQAAARALKIWTRSGNLPHISGWALEAMVIHLDQPIDTYGPLELFVRVLEWLDERATPAVIEGVLRPAAFPRWDEAWSARVPGRLEALRNSARALRRRTPPPESWRSAADVERWLCG